MTRQIWLNLPVKDIKASKMFFSKLGFSFNEQHDTEYSTCLLVGENNFVIMLFEEMMFQDFIKNKVGWLNHLSGLETAINLLVKLMI